MYDQNGVLFCSTPLVTGKYKQERFVKKGIITAAVFLMLCICTGCTSCTTAGPQGYHLVWSDEFNGKTIDTDKWDFQTGTGSQYGMTDWGNNELEYYTKDNAFIENGNLVIEARQETKEGKAYTSARLRTMKDDGTALYAKAYGRIEARIKMPAASRLWPAFWLLPATSDYGRWASSGEIDIMEAKGRLPGRVYGTVHYGMEWPGNTSSGSIYAFPKGTDLADYHVYALEWEPGQLRWLVDGKMYYQTSDWWSFGKDSTKPYTYPAPFDKPFYILLNLAVGGDFDSGGFPDISRLPARMYIDYVRVYDKNEPYETDVKRPESKKDSASFSTFAADTYGSFIADPDIEKANDAPMSENHMDVKSRSWYFLTLSEYEAQASSAEEKIAGASFRHIKIGKPGKENFSVQLIQHFPAAYGYSYCIEFDAKASGDRSIAVKVGGDADNSWKVYSPEFHPALTDKIRHYSYFFIMEDKTDRTARLEFNAGLDTHDVWIGNVTVKEASL